MAAANPTFEPVVSLDPRPRRRASTRSWPSPTLVACLLFAGLGLAALAGVGRRGRTAPPTAAPAAPFMAFAVGEAVERLEVVSAPGAGAVVGIVPAGARVGIAGHVAVDGIWSSGVAYWVSAEVDGHTVRGFVPAGAVTVRAGDPPPLSLDGGQERGPFEAPDVSGAVVAARGAAAGAAPIADTMGRGVSEEPGGAALSAARADDTVAASSTGDGAGPPEGRGDVAATAGVSIPWLPPSVRHWSDLLAEAARTHGVAADLLAIVTLVESGGHPSARSHVGATGLMQVMPATAGDIARQRGLGAFDPGRLHDPATAIDFGAWYLAQQLKSFGQADDPDWSRSVTMAAAAYNGGPGAAIRFRRDGVLPSETRHYIDWVGGMWRERAAPESPTYERWMAAGGRVLVAKAQAWLDAGGR